MSCDRKVFEQLQFKHCRDMAQPTLQDCQDCQVFNKQINVLRSRISTFYQITQDDSKMMEFLHNLDYSVIPMPITEPGYITSAKIWGCRIDVWFLGGDRADPKNYQLEME